MPPILQIKKINTPFEKLINLYAPLPDTALLETFPEYTGHSILAINPVPDPASKKIPPHPKFPFIEGHIGYTTYEGKSHFNYYTNSFQKLPNGDIYFIGEKYPDPAPTPPKFTATSPFTASSKEDYIKIIQTLQEKIKEGDVYQANLSYRYESIFKGHPFHLYEALKKESPTPYAAFLNFKDHQIISASPELFLKITPEGTLTTKPIKGTIHQTGNKTEDSALRQQLKNSEKDNAELLMITDLLRNDLGKIAKTGSVKVNKLAELENYAHLSHLVSTITATLKDDITREDALKSLFPGGSITGAPKHTAIKAIAELESTPRGPYTGTIGYHSICGNSQFSIAIRTAYTQKDKLYFHTGAGITTASDPKSEYTETQTKAKAFLNILTKKNRLFHK